MFIGPRGDPGPGAGPAQVAALSPRSGSGKAQLGRSPRRSPAQERPARSRSGKRNRRVVMANVYGTFDGQLVMDVSVSDYAVQ